MYARNLGTTATPVTLRVPATPVTLVERGGGGGVSQYKDHGYGDCGRSAKKEVGIGSAEDCRRRFRAHAGRFSAADCLQSASRTTVLGSACHSHENNPAPQWDTDDASNRPSFPAPPPRAWMEFGLGSALPRQQRASLSPHPHPHIRAG